MAEQPAPVWDRFRVLYDERVRLEQVEVERAEARAKAGRDLMAGRIRG